LYVMLLLILIGILCLFLMHLLSVVCSFCISEFVR
jgi:hypothetical protein